MREVGDHGMMAGKHQLIRHGTWVILVALSGVGACLAFEPEPGAPVEAATPLPPLPGAVDGGPTQTYRDPELGFEISLPADWVSPAPKMPGAGQKAAGAGWREFRSPDGILWVRVIRSDFVTGAGDAGMAPADREALAGWLAGSYYGWRWQEGPDLPPDASPATAAGTKLLFRWAGEGWDREGTAVRVYLWAAAATGGGQIYLLVAGGPVSAMDKSKGLLTMLAHSLRLVGPPAPAGLVPWSRPDLGVELAQPPGWSVTAGQSEGERVVKLAASDGKALLIVHLVPGDRLEPARSSQVTTGEPVPSFIELLGQVYLAGLTQPEEKGGEGLTSVEVKAAGLTRQRPDRFEALFTYTDPQAGPAAGWLSIEVNEPSNTIILLEARAVADRFELLYPTFRAIGESIRLVAPVALP